VLCRERNARERRGDHLVGGSLRTSSRVLARAIFARHGPEVDASERPNHLGVVEVDLDPA